MQFAFLTMLAAAVTMASAIAIPNPFPQSPCSPAFNQACIDNVRLPQSDSIGSIADILYSVLWTRTMIASTRPATAVRYKNLDRDRVRRYLC